jgi:hypothetical protein
MPRKSKTEVLPPARPRVVPDIRAMLDKLVEEKVAELMSNGGDARFQPYFQSNRVVAEVRRNQTVSERSKWTRYFKKWGCDVCGTRKRAHLGLGRCQACYFRTDQRLRELLTQAASEKAPMPVFEDRLGDLVRAALKTPEPLPPEKRMDLEWIARQALTGPVRALPAAPGAPKDRPKRTRRTQ